MEDHDNNPIKYPIPSMQTIWASWSVFLGAIGFVANCLCPLMQGIPVGLLTGLLGIACAVRSKKGKPFTQQAQLGLILSVLSAVCGLLMSLSTIFFLDVIGSDAPFYVQLRNMMSEYLRQYPELQQMYPQFQGL